MCRSPLLAFILVAMSGCYDNDHYVMDGTLYRETAAAQERRDDTDNSLVLSIDGTNFVAYSYAVGPGRDDAVGDARARAQRFCARNQRDATFTDLTFGRAPGIGLHRHERLRMRAAVRFSCTDARNNVATNGVTEIGAIRVTGP